MRNNTKWAAAIAAVLLPACGGGGGGDSGSAGSGNAAEASFGIVHLLLHSPADGAIDVAPGAAIVLDFDAAIAIDSLGDEDTWLRRSGTVQNLPGSFTLGNGGRRVTFQPQAPLALEADYDFQLSGLTCDHDGRLVDVTEHFSFRTVDTTPPELLGLDVVDQSTGRSRTGTFTFTFSEAIAPASLHAASLYLRDVYGASYPGSRTTAGSTVVFAPFADLPGDRQFTLTLTTAATDRAGNALPGASVTRFRTTGDGDSPSVGTMWPTQGGTGISPRVEPTYTFTESMDPFTVEPSSLVFQDEFGSLVPFAIHASDDQRTLRVQPTLPLQPGRRYSLEFQLGGAAATDVSGNPLTATQVLAFTTGTDAAAPAVLGSTPSPGETRVSTNAIVTITFDEALDPQWIGTSTVRMTAGGDELLAIVEQPTPTTVRVTPVELLPTDAVCTVTLQGGHEGLHDVAGNVLVADHVLSFTTSSHSELPHALLLPPDGATGVPRGARVSIVFDAPMDPTTLNGATVAVVDDLLQPVPGTLAIGGGNRVVTFTPTTAWAPGAHYRTIVRGGSGGARATSGNWFAADQQARFRAGSGLDATAPLVHVTLNGIDEVRAGNLVLPPYGFTIDVVVSDPGDQSTDIGSTEVVFIGPGAVPTPSTLFAGSAVDPTSLSLTVPASTPLAAGSWTLQVRVRDLSGNLGTSTSRAFQVAEATATLLPFERTQVVWVRTDLDRDGSQTADFDDDLLRLGLQAAGDPAGTNAAMRNLVLDGIIAQANRLYGRGERGEPLDAGSVGLRFTKRSPVAVAHMQMALGGFDPEGAAGRGYGATSSGVLGRAYYDYRNGNMAERNTAASPGLGVFPAEMWLYQTNIHAQLWPTHQTVFAQRFRPLCPDMGGTPVGVHPVDATVLAAGFDYENATTQQRARWLTIMQAADDWATVIGVILAHEVGHSVGLVAPGDAPAGLYGDGTLHDSYAGATEVMAPSVGYEAMVSLEFRFRDIDLAYLRQRILLR